MINLDVSASNDADVDPVLPNRSLPLMFIGCSIYVKLFLFLFQIYFEPIIMLLVSHSTEKPSLLTPFTRVTI